MHIVYRLDEKVNFITKIQFLVFDPGLPRKPIVLLTLGQTIEKFVLNKDLEI